MAPLLCAQEELQAHAIDIWYVYVLVHLLFCAWIALRDQVILALLRDIAVFISYVGWFGLKARDNVCHIKFGLSSKAPCTVSYPLDFETNDKLATESVSWLYDVICDLFKNSSYFINEAFADE